MVSSDVNYCYDLWVWGNQSFEDEPTFLQKIQMENLNWIRNQIPFQCREKASQKFWLLPNFVVKWQFVWSSTGDGQLVGLYLLVPPHTPNLADVQQSHDQNYSLAHTYKFIQIKLPRFTHK